MSKAPTMGHGLISVIGRRRSMEDAFTVFPNLVHLTFDDEESSYDFFAVFHGHGSHKVSNKCKERLHHLVAEELRGVGGTVVDWHTVMSSSFIRMDAEVAVAEGETSRTQHTSKFGGSTAVVAVIGKEEIVVANCGDCRVVVFRDGAALQLSRDHKPDKPNEKDRVEAPPGDVVYSRLLGVLTTPRSIEPEVEVCKREAEDDFLVIATNGLWDVMTNEMACDLVRRCFSGQVSKTVLDGVNGNCSAAAATMLAELAIARGSRDNISVIVVQLRSFDTDSSTFTK